MSLLLSLHLVLAAAPDAGVADRPATMRALFDALVGLEPYVASPEKLKTADVPAVRERLATLATLEHAFPKSAKVQEPATAALSGLFSRYARGTLNEFDHGNRAVVPMRVRTLMSLCFSCHSRERVVHDFVDADKKLNALELTPMERGQWLAATRQFDLAMGVYDAQLDLPLNSERALYDASRALRELVSILVRVKDDPDMSGAVLDRAARNKDLPAFQKRVIAGWKKDITAWKKEKFDAQKATPAQLFARAKALVEQANGAQRLLPDEGSDVPFLRASGYLNLALAKDPALPQRGQALLLLGVTSSALRSPLLWDLDALFFEECIRENPHTVVAKQCLKQTTDRVYFGYTGSSGVNVPDEELQRLMELRSLAE